ncbi:MAG: hypothetical protein ACI8PZ_003184 [Myxococcota bacterium]
MVGLLLWLAMDPASAYCPARVRQRTIPNDKRRAVLPLPPVGSTAWAVLDDDGSPVWIVHHGPDCVSVLDATLREPYFPGMRRLVGRHSDSGGFYVSANPPAADADGVWREGDAWIAAMPAFRIDVQDQTVIVGARRGGARSTYAPPERFYVIKGTYEYPLRDAPEPLQVVLDRNDGKFAMVDAILWQTPGQPVRICQADTSEIGGSNTFEGCPDDSPVAAHVPPSTNSIGFFGPPLLLRFEHGQAVDVVRANHHHGARSAPGSGR